MANFSRDPNDVLNDADLKGYSRILFQQGKPVCDFELTLLGDLASPQRIADRYIGNGVPIGPDDSFAIDNLDIAAGDFTIRAGRCLVNGYEVLLRTATTYKTQPHKEQVRRFPPNKLINVYLRVFPREITDSEDEALQNKGDVGVVTTVREKTDWEVLATDATINLRDHFLLATFNTRVQSDSVTGTLVDRRRKGLTMAKLRDEFDALGGAASNLNDRLNASLNPDGTLKNNVVGNAQLANECVNDKKLASNAVNQTALAPNAVSTRTIQNGAVSMEKLGVTPVFDGLLSVPVAKAVGAVGQQVIVPGETTISLQAADEHAIYLISVRASSDGLGKEEQASVNWMHRSTSVVRQKPGSEEFVKIHEHQVVLQNFSTVKAVTAGCRAFRIADT